MTPRCLWGKDITIDISPLCWVLKLLPFLCQNKKRYMHIDMHACLTYILGGGVLFLGLITTPFLGIPPLSSARGERYNSSVLAVPETEGT